MIAINLLNPEEEKAEYKRRRQRERNRAYKKANREKVNAASLAYKKANREKVLERGREYDRTYREANREKVLERKRARYEANREQLLADQRARYATPKGKAQNQVRANKRRARLRDASSPGVPAEQWRRIVEHYFASRCGYCGARAAHGAHGALQVEHLIPIARGGRDEIGNVIPACQKCNFSKGSKSLREWVHSGLPRAPSLNSALGVAVAAALLAPLKPVRVDPKTAARIVLALPRR